MDLTPPTPITEPSPPELSLSRPVHRLDVHSLDLHYDAAVMRKAGAVVPVQLPGGVPVWAITRDATARAALRNTDIFRKDPRHWAALQRGEIPADWPLIGLAAPAGPSLITTDGVDHWRLRGPLSTVFTETRVRALRTSIGIITKKLLSDLADAATVDGIVDFRKLVAWPLPMTVISLLLGLPESEHDALRSNYEIFFDDTRDPTAALAAIEEIITRHLDAKRRHPGDDLTSALLQLPRDEQLTTEELVATVQVLIAAGHETTVHLLVNGVLALTSHRDQLDLLLQGEVSWDRAVEEILRWEPPTANFLMRFATRDSILGDAFIRRGDPVMVCYAAMGRDPNRYGPTADDFDITREGGHTSFGHGPHTCIGAPLARLEGRIVLQELFSRWPDLAPDAPAPRFPSVLMNSRTCLPICLRPSHHPHEAGAAK
ncbi:cytochrome P450 family protein [Streptomyces lydicus]|uniref:cytochrome P450 family protein n=1 Tax=Streptomyces lydicus TaxID=47763 RepID=UPI0019D6C131|nr:cytochrome P450 [Streptomyces lydicus]MCZ1006732.1 cytochrome P450 [Streptomyces lydicus]